MVLQTKNAILLLISPTHWSHEANLGSFNAIWELGSGDEEPRHEMY